MSASREHKHLKPRIMKIREFYQNHLICEGKKSVCKCKWKSLVEGQILWTIEYSNELLVILFSKYFAILVRDYTPVGILILITITWTPLII